MKLKSFAYTFLITFLMIPGLAYAGPADWAKKGIVGIFDDWISGLIGEVVSEVITKIINSLDLDGLGIWSLVDTSEYIAVVLALTITMFRAVKFYIDSTAGVSQDTPGAMAKDLLQSIVLIFSIRYFVGWMLKLSSAFVEAIKGAFPVDFHGWISVMLLHPETASMVILIALLIFLIILLIAVIIAGIRQFEIAMLLIFGPIMAATVANKGETFNVWFREAIAVIFTQPVQFIVLTAMMKWIQLPAATDGVPAQPHFWNYVAAIGAGAALIKGPQVLRQFLWSSGAGGSVIGGASKLASYKFMAKSMVKAG